ncbi:hypothetical protein NMG60_11007359 [Bertholletia excelsa]
MSKSGDFSQNSATYQFPARPPEDALRQAPAAGGADPRVPLLNLTAVRERMDHLQSFLSQSVNSNIIIGKDQMNMVSNEISSAIQQIIVNGAALLACSQRPSVAPNPPSTANLNSVDNTGADLKISDTSGDFDFKTFVDPTGKEKSAVELKIRDEETKDEDPSQEWEIIELDTVELLAEHIHFCDICGKGFKRDANLRMHMRAHGDEFKTLEALAKPEKSSPEPSLRKRRFSCPFAGCNRNKSHKKFRPLKSAICVKNHFKRSHCPKMYSCTRCHKKSFSVLADLKSHLKHCGESKWKCSCGTSFSRKDKLFGHMALFEGHMPAVVEDEKSRGTEVAAGAVAEDDEEDECQMVKEADAAANSADSGFLDNLLDGFGSIEGYCLQDILESPYSFGTKLNEFYSF